ncbi:hypothetical protein AAEX37_01191 [Oligella sp. MSHR50489EDL]|uniref:helix-turn-helix domain-containing protein n=1 Tax=Oligella sp. MSHR50489EDL TaxID=3139409 RepID=UPI003D813FC6
MRTDSSFETPLVNDSINNRLGLRVRAFRKNQGLTLVQLSQKSNISVSTLSKIENHLLSPTYERLIDLARGLGIHVSELFDSPSEQEQVSGRMSVTRKGQGRIHDTELYTYEMLCTQLASKRMFPIYATIKAHDSLKLSEYQSHEGEEFFYVIEGSITLRTQFYEDIVLNSGDSCYIDSQMAHLIVANDEDAHIIWVASHQSATTR